MAITLLSNLVIFYNQPKPFINILPYVQKNLVISHLIVLKDFYVTTYLYGYILLEILARILGLFDAMEIII